MAGPRGRDSARGGCEGGLSDPLAAAETAVPAAPTPDRSPIIVATAGWALATAGSATLLRWIGG